MAVSGDLFVNSTYNLSDQRLKCNIRTIEGALAVVSRLRGCWFDWQSPHPQARTPAVGVVAQGLMEEIPGCVIQDPVMGLHSVNYLHIIPYLI